MAYDGWEMGFEASRSGAGRKQWSRTVRLGETAQENIDSPKVNASANKKLSRCVFDNRQQVVLLDSDMIVWER